MMNKILTLLLFCFLFNCNNNAKKTKEVIEEVQQEQEVKLVKEKKAVKPIKQIHNIPFLTVFYPSLYILKTFFFEICINLIWISLG